jgi:serine/threonine-protein kinase
MRESAVNFPTDEILAAWISGSLDASELDEVQAHAAGCPGCRRLAVVMAEVGPRNEPAGFGAEGGVIGRYRVTGSIGQGAMGVVLRGHDPVLDREVAIKVSRDLDVTDQQREGMLREAHTLARIDPTAAPDSTLGREVGVHRPLSTTPSGDAIARFLREARIQARLDHPSIVPVYELGTDAEGTPYFTMKRLAGVPLGERLSDPATDTRTLLNAFVAVCAAIDLAHARGVVHRDLKPENIVLGDYREVYVLDWGVARVLDELETRAAARPDDDAMHTQTGTLIGTPRYMAPEQARGEAVGPPADVFALGAILFEILAGKPLRARDLTVAGTSPAQRRPDRTIAPELDALCCAALADAASDRPSVHELGERVQRYLDGDRDLEQRKRLARTELGAARAALATGDGPSERQLAMRAAARALALDPTNREPAELVGRLMLEPPRDTPPEIAERMIQLDKDRAYAGRVQARWAALAYLTLAPAAASLAGLRRWCVAIMFAASLAMVLVTYLAPRSRQVAVWRFTLSCVLIITVTESVATTPFVIVPGLLLITTGLLTMTRQSAIPLPVIVALLLSAALVPFLLTLVGWLPQNCAIVGNTIVMTAASDGLDPTFALIGLTATLLAMVLLVAVIVQSLVRDRREAHRKVEIQAWQLRQLVAAAE